MPTFSKAMSHLDTSATRELDRVGFPAGLRDLVRLRASQLNGCAYVAACTAPTPPRAQRINAVAIWRESPFFTERERAALAFTGRHRSLHPAVPAEEYDAVAAHGRPTKSARCSR